MIVSFFFTHRSIVFVSGVAVNGRRIRSLKLSPEELEAWKERIGYFAEKKLWLAQRYTHSTQPRVGFHGFPSDETHLAIVSGDDAQALTELLLLYNPDVVTGIFPLVHSGKAIEINHFVTLLR